MIKHLNDEIFVKRNIDIRDHKPELFHYPSL